MLEAFEKKPMIWWRYIDDIFFICDHGEAPLKIFFEQVEGALVGLRQFLASECESPLKNMKNAFYFT